MLFRIPFELSLLVLEFAELPELVLLDTACTNCNYRPLLLEWYEIYVTAHNKVHEHNTSNNIFYKYTISMDWINKKGLRPILVDLVEPFPKHYSQVNCLCIRALVEMHRKILDACINVQILVLKTMVPPFYSDNAIQMIPTVNVRHIRIHPWYYLFSLGQLVSFTHAFPKLELLECIITEFKFEEYLDFIVDLIHLDLVIKFYPHHVITKKQAQVEIRVHGFGRFDFGHMICQMYTHERFLSCIDSFKTNAEDDVVYMTISKK